jgi:hypothetical protein
MSGICVLLGIKCRATVIANLQAFASSCLNDGSSYARDLAPTQAPILSCWIACRPTLLPASLQAIWLAVWIESRKAWPHAVIETRNPHDHAANNLSCQQ